MLEKNIKNLIKILEESNIDDMEISTFWGKQRIRIRKNILTYSDKNIDIIQENTDISNISTSNSQHNEVLKNEPKKVESKITTPDSISTDLDKSVYIKAPLVGTFYRSSSPDDPPFISEGDIVKKGQSICIIEAMKIFNEIESEYSGKIENILIKDATPIEYDQDLIVISPE